MHGLAKEQLIAGVLKQLGGTLVDENSHEYNLLIIHQREGQCGFVVRTLEQDETIFSLVPPEQYQIDRLQKVVESENDDLFESEIEITIEKVLTRHLRIGAKEIESVKDYLTVSILYWIFNSYVVTEQTPPELRTNDLVAEKENSFLFGFGTTHGYNTSVVIEFDDKFLHQVQHAIDEKNYGLLTQYMALIKEHIIMLCTAQAEHGNSHWSLTTEIFVPPRLQILD